MNHLLCVRFATLARNVIGCAALLAGLAAAASTAQADDPKLKDNRSLDQAVDALLKQHGPGLEISLWLGTSSGEAWYQRNATAVRPTASAIKAFYLVVFYDRYKDQLDQPLPGAAKILNDDNHPAISHFTEQQRADIRGELTTATVRHIGEVMIGKAKVSNPVYNAAANLITAVLGGPEALTKSIRQLDPAFKTVTARRYMLRDRKQPGDNEATAAAFAALYQRLATGSLSGIDDATLAAVHSTLLWEQDPKQGARYSKGGALNSDPLTRVHAGWWDTPAGQIVYVVMTEQPAPGGSDEKAAVEAVKAISTTAVDLNKLLVEAGRARQR